MFTKFSLTSLYTGKYCQEIGLNIFFPEFRTHIQQHGLQYKSDDDGDDDDDDDNDNNNNNNNNNTFCMARQTQWASLPRC